jgi:DNA-directed RNA polymerase specialized sigma24 family protein
MTNATTDAKSVAESVFRQQSGRIIATLIRISGSFDLAEEALQDALMSAIARWPQSGVPDNPAAWITTAAHRRLIDALRRNRTRREKEDPLRYETPTSYHPDEIDAEAAFDASSTRSPCALWAALQLLKLRARFSCPRQRWRSASFAQNRKSRRHTFRMKFRRCTRCRND